MMGVARRRVFSWVWVGEAMGRIVQVLGVVIAFFAVIFLFIGLLWTEWPQTLVGVALALLAALVWMAGSRVVAHS